MTKSTTAEPVEAPKVDREYVLEKTNGPPLGFYRGPPPMMVAAPMPIMTMPMVTVMPPEAKPKEATKKKEETKKTAPTEKKIAAKAGKPKKSGCCS